MEQTAEWNAPHQPFTNAPTVWAWVLVWSVWTVVQSCMLLGGGAWVAGSCAGAVLLSSLALWHRGRRHPAPNPANEQVRERLTGAAWFAEGITLLFVLDLHAALPPADYLVNLGSVLLLHGHYAWTARQATRPGSRGGG